eukprot:190859-Amphidinium_carterae.1
MGHVKERIVQPYEKNIEQDSSAFLTGFFNPIKKTLGAGEDLLHQDFTRIVHTYQQTSLSGYYIRS